MNVPKAVHVSFDFSHLIFFLSAEDGTQGALPTRQALEIPQQPPPSPRTFFDDRIANHVRELESYSFRGEEMCRSYIRTSTVLTSKLFWDVQRKLCKCHFFKRKIFKAKLIPAILLHLRCKATPPPVLSASHPSPPPPDVCAPSQDQDLRAEQVQTGQGVWPRLGPRACAAQGVVSPRAQAVTSLAFN